MADIALQDRKRRVRISAFPASYSGVRHLLGVWPGRPRAQINGLWEAIRRLTGTPQDPVSWTDPDTWIPKRLSGSDRELAAAIWTTSAGTVNPRHAHDHWRLCETYGLIEEAPNGNFTLTDRGSSFIAEEGGEVEVWLDEQEGLLELLTLVDTLGPARTGGLLEGWAEYLEHHSSFASPSTRRESLYYRLRNLRGRALVSREGYMYSITDDGLALLGRVGENTSSSGHEQQELGTLVKQQKDSVLQSLRDRLLQMEPYAFEHLVKLLLEAMDYQNVEVTKPSGDGGVDVVADIQIGISSVREVVQAKRHRYTIQRKDLDALRGSLYRFGAVRGTIITTSRFSKGTEEAAFDTGAAPITLIDGDNLIRLLVQYEIGVRKRRLEVLELDPEAFSNLEQDA